METTLTQRDKALLIILGIILVVFAAVMIPKVGIYALIKSRKEVATEITAQKNENDQMLMELIQSGINGAYAESGAMARNYLSRLLLAEKHDSAKLSTAISRAKSFDTAKDWLYATKFKGYVMGEDAYFDKLNVLPTDAQESATILMYEIPCMVNTISADLEVTTSIEDVLSFDLDYCTNLESLNDLANMVLLSSQATRKGSCVVSVFSFAKAGFDQESSGNIKISVVVITPVSEDLSNYASQICECHNCGYAYYKSAYDDELADKLITEGDSASIVCPECQEELDGTSIG